MVQLKQTSDRRPRVDEIFDYLYNEIGSMRLKPGDRISEADIAAKFGVSREPVRDAFSRLESLDLLLIRPQERPKSEGSRRWKSKNRVSCAQPWKRKSWTWPPGGAIPLVPPC